MANKKKAHLSDKAKRLTPELVMKMLKEKGQSVSISEAEEILKFLQKMANITVSNYLNPQHLSKSVVSGFES